jgi:hypothetical protein
MLAKGSVARRTGTPGVSVLLATVSPAIVSPVRPVKLEAISHSRVRPGSQSIEIIDLTTKSSVTPKKHGRVLEKTGKTTTG